MDSSDKSIIRCVYNAVRGYIFDSIFEIIPKEKDI